MLIAGALNITTIADGPPAEATTPRGQQGSSSLGTIICGRRLSLKHYVMEYKNGDQNRCSRRGCVNSGGCRLCTAESHSWSCAGDAVADIDDFTARRFDGNQLV